MASGDISVVHVVSGDLWGGAENLVYQLVKQQMKRPGMRVSVVVLNPGQLHDELTSLSVPILLLDETCNSFLTVLKAALRFVREWHADKGDGRLVIHGHRKKENLIAAFLALRLKAKAVRTLHGGNEHSGSRSLKTHLSSQIESFFSKRFLHGNVAVSRELEGKLLAEGFNRAKVRIISNGIDFENLEVLAKTQAQASPPLGRRSGRGFAVGIVGRLVPVKRHDIFVEIAARLTSEAQPTEFFIVGDGPLYSDIQNRVDQAGLGSAVSLLGFRQNVYGILWQLDAVLILSDHEGLPLNLLESIGLGVPVIGHAVGGVRELLADYPALHCYPPLENSVSEALAKLIAGDPVYDAQFQVCQRSVRSKYSIQWCEKNYHALYTSVSDEN